MNINTSTRWQKFLQSLKKREVATTTLLGKKAANQPEVLEARIAPAAVLDILAGEDTSFTGDSASDNTTVFNVGGGFTGFYNSGGLTSPDVDGVNVVTISANEIHVLHTLIDGGTFSFTGGGGTDDMLLNSGLSSFNGLSVSDYDTVQNLPALTIGGGGLFIEATGGDVTVTGNISKTTGGDATATFRASGSVTVNSGADITSSAGKLHVVLNADRDASGSGGVYLLSGGTTITTNGGDFTIGGGASPATTAVFGPTDKGIYMDGVTISTDAGNISIRGQGDATSGGGASIGIDLTGTSISSTSGNITLVGTGGAVSDNFTMGVSLYSGSSINTGTGAIAITGTTSATGTNAYGVKVQLNSSVNATGNGTISITGTGSSSAGGSANEGIALFDNADVTSAGNGALTFTATGGASSHGFITGSTANDITIGGGSATGGLTFVSNSMSFDTANTTIQTTGTATFRQATNGTAIDLGSTSGVGSSLNLSDAELDRVTAATVQIGDVNSGAISVSAAISHANHLSLTTGAGVSGSAGLTLAAGKNLTVSANGAVSLTGAIIVPGTATIAAGAANNVTLSSGSNDFSTLVITSGNNVSVTDSSALVLGASTVSGTLSVTTSGAITQSGALSVTGAATYAAGSGNNITLNNAGNAHSTVIVTSANNVSLADVDGLILGTSTVSGTLDVTTSGAITQSGALTVTGATTLAAGAANNITLGSANDFSTLVITSGNNVSVTDANALILGASTVSGTFGVTTSGAITQSGALTEIGRAHV